MVISLRWAGVLSLLLASICSADAITITSTSYTITGFANIPSKPTSYSLTDTSPLSLSILADSHTPLNPSAAYASSSANGLNLSVNAWAVGSGFAGASASATLTFQVASDTLTVSSVSSFYVGDFGIVSSNFSITDLDTGTTIGGGGYGSHGYQGNGQRQIQNGSEDIHIDPNHTFSITMSLTDSRVGEVGDDGTFSVALSAVALPVPLPSPFAMGLILASLTGLGAYVRRVFARA